MLYQRSETLKRNEKGTKKERALLVDKKERNRNAFLKISKGTKKERVPQKFEKLNSLIFGFSFQKRQMLKLSE